MSDLPNFLGHHYQAEDTFNWSISWGSKLIHQKIVPLLSKGDKVLDIGSGWGRASLCFALHGCNVTLFDTNEDALKLAEECAASVDRRVKTILGDISELSEIVLPGQFQTVILSEATVHIKKSDSHRLIADACKLLAPGGIIYVDAPSSNDWHYSYFIDYNERIDTDTFLDICDCSGEPQYEPFCFYHPGELCVHLNHHGLRIIHQDSSLIEKEAIKTVAIAQRPYH